MRVHAPLTAAASFASLFCRRTTHTYSQPSFTMPLLGVDNQEGGDGPFHVLPMVGAVVAMALLLLAFGVMMALKYGGNAQAGDSDGDSALSVGCTVKIHGLQSEKGKALNGKSGKITTELDVQTGRCGVRLMGRWSDPGRQAWQPDSDSRRAHLWRGARLGRRGPSCPR